MTAASQYIAQAKTFWLRLIPTLRFVCDDTVANGDIVKGDTILAWFDVVEQSLPAQTTATRVMVIKMDKITEKTEIKFND